MSTSDDPFRIPSPAQNLEMLSTASTESLWGTPDTRKASAQELVTQDEAPVGDWGTPDTRKAFAKELSKGYRTDLESLRRHIHPVHLIVGASILFITFTGQWGTFFQTVQNVLNVVIPF